MQLLRSTPEAGSRLPGLLADWRSNRPSKPKPGVAWASPASAVPSRAARPPTASTSTSFDVTVTGGGLGNLTIQFVQGFAAYRALRPAQRAVVDRLAAALIRGLEELVPRLTPAQRRAVIRVYQAGVGALVSRAG